MSTNLRFLVPPPMSMWNAEKVSQWFLHVWFPPWCMEVWWCGGALLVTLLVIHSKFKAHSTSMDHTTLQRHAIPSSLRLVDHHLFFNRTKTSNIPPGYVKVISPRRRIMECCVRWPGLHNHLTYTQLRWLGMSWTTEWRNSSQQVFSTSGNSFKTVGKPFQVTTSWIWLREECAKLSSKQKVATLKNLKYTTFSGLTLLCLLHSPMCVLS